MVAWYGAELWGGGQDRTKVPSESTVADACLEQHDVVLLVAAAEVRDAELGANGRMATSTATRCIVVALVAVVSA